MGSPSSWLCPEFIQGRGDRNHKKNRIRSNAASFRAPTGYPPLAQVTVFESSLENHNIQRTTLRIPCYQLHQREITLHIITGKPQCELFPFVRPLAEYQEPTFSRGTQHMPRLRI